MAVSLVRYGLRTLVNLEKNAAVLSVNSVRNQYKVLKTNFLKCIYRKIVLKSLTLMHSRYCNAWHASVRCFW